MKSEPVNRELSTLLARGPIERVVAKYQAGQQPSEVDAAAHLSGEERLALLVEMQARHLRWRHGIEPGLERVAVVVDKARR
ncbi:hypothetical protein MASR1M8_27490 [Thermomonas brevis]